MKRKFSFTLVELLIVASIIAILASLLLPALSSVKAKVKSINCINNMKQIGYGITMYSDDNSGRIPDEIGPGSGKGYWYGSLVSYTGKLEKNLIYRCPSDRNPLWGIVSYGINNNLDGEKLSSIKTISRKGMIIDSNGSYSLSAWHVDDEASGVSLRHNNGANVLFADFHVKWLQYLEILYPQGSTEWRMFWIKDY